MNGKSPRHFRASFSVRNRRNQDFDGWGLNGHKGIAGRTFEMNGIDQGEFSIPIDLLDTSLTFLVDPNGSKRPKSKMRTTPAS